MSFEKFLADIGDCIFLGNFKRNDVIRLPCLGDPFKYDRWLPAVRTVAGNLGLIQVKLTTAAATVIERHIHCPLFRRKNSPPDCAIGILPGGHCLHFFVFFFFFRIFHIKHTGAIFTDHTPDVCIVF